MTNTTIAISKDVHNDLTNLKILERETFNDVIKRLINAFNAINPEVKECMKSMIIEMDLEKQELKKEV